MSRILIVIVIFIVIYLLLKHYRKQTQKKMYQVKIHQSTEKIWCVVRTAVCTYLKVRASWPITSITAVKYIAMHILKNLNNL